MDRICKKCNLSKNIGEFSKNKKCKDGYTHRCKKCTSEYNKKYWQNNIEKLTKINKEYYKNNKEHFKVRNKEYYENNKKQIFKQCNIRKKQRKQEDINYRLSCNLRTRLSNALKRDQKAGSAIDDLGCSIDEFKKYIESQFEEWMTWDNYGDWHIDHIKPLANFDLTDKEQLKKACHYTNLQPLEKTKNIIKSNNID